MTEMVIMTSPKPAHVPDDLVVDFDFNRLYGGADEFHTAYTRVRDSSPDIFWTPHNGGHWVMTRAKDVIAVLRDTDRFSNRHITLPPLPEDYPNMIPTELDPPVHGRYRKPLVEGMLPRVINRIENEIRTISIEAIERVLPNGGCEFIGDFARVVPIHVYFRLVDLPLDDKAYMLALADKTARGGSPESQMAGFNEMGEYLATWVRKRREAPGSDLLSKVVTLEVDGKPISDAEAVNYATVILFGGLETVATMMGFFARFLAEHPEHRRQLLERIDDEGYVKKAIEELLRCHGIASAARRVTKDLAYRGVDFRKGDMVLPATQLVGLDDRVNADPFEVDFDRPEATTTPFGFGRHACPGSVLARREMQVFLEEWLPRIPDFRVKPGTRPEIDGNSAATAMLRLDLVWP